MAHYIHDDLNNRIEGLSKEEIYALIDEVIESGELPTDIQGAFVTAIKSIVDGVAYKMAFCTQAEYNSLEAQGLLETNALYIITDDTTADDISETISSLLTSVSNLETNVDNKVNKSAFKRTHSLLQAFAESLFNLSDATSIVDALSKLKIWTKVTTDQTSYTTDDYVLLNVYYQVRTYSDNDNLYQHLSFNYNSSQVLSITREIIDPSGTPVTNWSGDVSATIVIYNTDVDWS